MFLTVLVLAALMFLTEYVLIVLIFLTELALTVLSLTELVFTVLVFLPEGVQRVHERALHAGEGGMEAVPDQFARSQIHLLQTRVHREH
jgi:hypothetical protein